MIERSLALFFLCFSLAVEPLHAQVIGRIIGPGAERYPIAVSLLKDLGTGPDGKRFSEGIADAIARASPAKPPVERSSPGPPTRFAR